MNITVHHSKFRARRSGWFFIQSVWFPSMLTILTLTLAGLISHSAGRATVLSFLLVAAGFILLFDAMARGSMYLYYSTTTKTLNSLRVITNCRKSFCSRQVAIALYGSVARKIYKELGYRWYHLTPDGTWRWNSIFFRPVFWKAVFQARV